jgi:hypothetical protein
MAYIYWIPNSEDGAVQQTQWLYLDTILSQEFTRAGELTTFPIERGQDVADNYKPGPAAISLEVFISNTPLKAAPEDIVRTSRSPKEYKPARGDFAPKELNIPPYDSRTRVYGLPGQRVIQGNVERAKHNAPKFATVLQFAEEVHRVEDVFFALDRLMTNTQPVTILFNGHEYSDLCITNLRAPKTVENGSGMSFFIDLVEISTVSPILVNAPKSTNPVAPEHKPAVDRGRGSPKKPTAMYDSLFDTEAQFILGGW